MAHEAPRGQAAEIIERHLSGDRAAFGELVTLYGPEVRKRCRIIIRGRADVDDAVQEVWVSVARHVENFRHEAAFTSWLYQITTCCALMALRNVWRNQGPPCDNERSNDAPPDEVVDHRRQLRRIRVALRGLTPSQRAAFILGVVDGQSHQETGVPKAHLSDARAKLRRVV